MKKMKLTAFLLAALMAASMLAGCGNDQEVSSDESSESSIALESDSSSEDSSAESGLESSETAENSQDAESSQNESAEPAEESSAPESSAETSKPSSSNTSSSKPASKPTSKPSSSGSSSKPSAESSTQTPPPAQSVDTSDTTPEGAEVSLSSIIDGLYAGIPEEDMPMVMNTTLSSENSEYYVGVPFSSYTEGVASDSAIGSIAHSICLLRAADADQAAALAKEVKEKANPRKWVCVEAEKVIVKQKGDLVLLIMTSADKADTISANFDNLDV